MSKFFASHWKESMAGHMGVNGVHWEGKYKGSTVGAGEICRQREHASLLQVLLKLTEIYGRGGTR
jgi:hypothetical protein